MDEVTKVRPGCTWAGYLIGLNEVFLAKFEPQQLY